VSYLRTIGRALIGKASAVGPMTARMMLHMPAWSERNFERLAREAYVQNAVASRAIQMIAENAATIPMKFTQGRGKNAKTIDEHELLDLLDNPNPMQHGTEFMVALYSYLMITGNNFVERTNETRLDRMELYNLRPDRTQVIPGITGAPEGYLHRVGGDERTFKIDVDKGLMPVMHLKRFNPINDWYGMSPLDPAAWGIDIHNASGAWNKALLDNAAAPSGAFVYSGSPEAGNTMGDDQYARLKQELDTNVRGARNAGKPLLLEGGLDWKQMGMSPDTMKAVDTKNQAAREIAFTLGVPPMLLGIPGDNTYSNYVEANRAFYRQTVIPLVRWNFRAFENWFGPLLGKDVHITPDLDQVDALAVEREAQWDRIEKSSSMTINEKRKARGLDPVDGGDELYVGSGQLPISHDATVKGGAAPEDDAIEPKKPGKDKPANGKHLN
jgi:HK97 family phage portal protein